MKKALLCLLVSVAGFTQAGTKPAKNPVVAPAPVDDSLGFSLTAGYDSSYIFRGVNYGDHLMSVGLSQNDLLRVAANFHVGVSLYILGISQITQFPDNLMADADPLP